jgi:hypothetical protein
VGAVGVGGVGRRLGRGGQQEALAADDADSESELEDVVECKGNLRGAPAVTHRTLRSSLGSRGSTQRKAAVASWPSGASGMNVDQDETRHATLRRGTKMCY